MTDLEAARLVAVIALDTLIMESFAAAQTASDELELAVLFAVIVRARRALGELK